MLCSLYLTSFKDLSENHKEKMSWHAL